MDDSGSFSTRNVTISMIIFERKWNFVLCKASIVQNCRLCRIISEIMKLSVKICSYNVLSNF